MKVAVAGHRGRLGSYLVRLGCVPLVCDITSERSIAEALEAVEPHVLINAAAFTDVDACEEPANQDLAVAVNTRGPGLLRRAFPGFFIHLSTGYVFDGRAGPYDEDAVPNPISFYGMTKLGGEAAATVRTPTAIVRTLDLFGSAHRRPDFVRFVRDLLAVGLPKPVPTGLYGNPTYIPNLAAALMRLAEAGPQDTILNLAGTTVLSRFDFARMIARVYHGDDALILPCEEPTGKARRPLRGGLLVTKALGLGYSLISAEEGLRELHAAETHGERVA